MFLVILVGFFFFFSISSFIFYLLFDLFYSPVNILISIHVHSRPYVHPLDHFTYIYIYAMYLAISVDIIIDIYRWRKSAKLSNLILLIYYWFMINLCWLCGFLAAGDLGWECACVCFVLICLFMWSETRG